MKRRGISRGETIILIVIFLLLAVLFFIVGYINFDTITEIITQDEEPEDGMEGVDEMGDPSQEEEPDEPDDTEEEIEEEEVEMNETEEVIPFICEFGTEMSPVSTCDYRLSLQDQYLDDAIYSQMDHLGIADTGWTISGGWLLAGVGQTEEEMLAATKEEIRDRFLEYLDRDHITLQADTTEFVDINIEHPIQPYNLYLYDETTTPKQSEIIEAWRLRIEVVREELPSAKLAFFQIPKAGTATGKDGTVGQARMGSYITAGELGFYDDLDYLSPPLYLFFPPGDPNHGKVEEFTRDVMERSETLINLFGPDSLKVAPFLHMVYINEDPFTGERVFITEEEHLLQISVLQEYDFLGIINYWAQDEWHAGFPDYFSEVKPVACSCFNPDF